MENLSEARSAIEIDAGGRIVLPAFVDPDIVLIPGRDDQGRSSVATLSKRRLEDGGKAVAEDAVRHGVLAVGASTRGTADERDIRKLLTVQKSFQARPLRIRSVFAPDSDALSLCRDPADLAISWATGIVARRLAGLLELCLPEHDSDPAYALLGSLARAAVSEGFIFRVRSPRPLTTTAQRWVAGSGSIAVVAPGGDGEPLPAFARSAGVWVLTAADILNHAVSTTHASELLNEGCPVALASGYPGSGNVPCNPQYLLHLASSRLGMQTNEAITALTWNAACSLRMSSVAGSIEPGKQADLTIFDVRDYRDLALRPGCSDVHMVIRAGRPVYRRAGLLPAWLW